jgi:serine/threonine-protein kinase
MHARIASGGMASVHFGRLSGPVGFSRVVAIKTMRPTLARDPEFISMFVDEATLSSRVQHPNVVPVLDVVVEAGQIFIVMEYVHGQSLSALLTEAIQAREPVPIPIATSILCGVLEGLHAAHEARDRRGTSLAIVHRDVSPQNVLVGADGLARIMDFGIAKANSRLSATQEGQLKGKLSYMAPEQVRGQRVDRRSDVFAAAAVLWGVLAGRRLFRGDDVADTMSQVLGGEVPPLSGFRPDIAPALDAAILAALARDPAQRPQTARDFARAIEAAAPRAAERDVGAWVERLAAGDLAARAEAISLMEDTGVTMPLAQAIAPAAGGDGDGDPTKRDRPAAPRAIEEEPSLSTAPTLELPRPDERGGGAGLAAADGAPASPADHAAPGGAPRTGAVAAAIGAVSLGVLAWAFLRGGEAPEQRPEPPPSAIQQPAAAAPVVATTVVAELPAPSASAPVEPERTAVPTSSAKPLRGSARPRATASSRTPPTTPNVGHIPAEP